MASRRRKAAGAERSSSKSPARRSSRRRGVGHYPASAQDAESPCIQSETKGEPPGEPPLSPRLPADLVLSETCSYKTPKRRQARRTCLPTFSSPVNENDGQQEIFWDPHSPIAHQLDNGRRKHTVRHGCTVEISEIVNRIAPQDNKPACYEGNLLGLWIGDDAIPCTPGITKVRSRTKVNGARGLQLKNKEEELMKLAKQFDKNLTEAIQDQDTSCHSIDHVAPETEMSIECEDEAQRENQRQFLEEHLPTNVTVPCGVIEESSRRLGHCENSNQEPIDLDAEGALNELFDGPTQACSDPLSQGLSNCSSNSSFLQNQNIVRQDECASDQVTSAAGAGTRDAPQGQDSTAALTESVAPFPAKKAEVPSEQAAPSVVSSKAELAASSKLERIVGDDFDDWGDDSFLMQITQNPELISTPENVFPCSDDSAKMRERTRDAVQGRGLNSFENVAASLTLPKQSIGIDKMNDVPLEFEKSVSKNSSNKISGYNTVLVQPKSQSIQQNFTQLKCPAKTNSSEKGALPIVLHPNLPKTQTRKYGSNPVNIYCQLPTSSASITVRGLKSTTDAISSDLLKPREAPKKTVFVFDNWNEPKFPDEVLDFYCESDNLWGVNCDDDDLLYQVCDDVEKNTQSQQAVEKNEKAKWVVEPPSILEAGPCPTVPDQGLSHCPQAQKTHLGRKTFSLDAPAVVATMLKKEHPPHPAVKQPSKSESTRSVPEKWCRSHSVPEGDLSSRTGSPMLSNGHPNVNNGKWQNGLCHEGKVEKGSLINQMIAVKSNYVFRKTGQSRALALDHENRSLGTLSGTHLGLLESRNTSNVPLQTTVQTNTKPPFKRHLSDSFAQFEAEQRSRRCSQEEITRKKQEALERRKWKMEALLKNTAAT
uniref:Ewing's tumor-associated antigen 1 isoform X3 n=1 Tax=Pogona vitticeps TaxID=103695 RepID=A0ABM5FP30_9SAUR